MGVKVPFHVKICCLRIREFTGPYRSLGHFVYPVTLSDMLRWWIAHMFFYIFIIFLESWGSVGSESMLRNVWREAHSFLLEGCRCLQSAAQAVRGASSRAREIGWYLEGFCQKHLCYARMWLVFEVGNMVTELNSTEITNKYRQMWYMYLKKGLRYGITLNPIRIWLLTFTCHCVSVFLP